MRTSTERILTTHCGSLPRPKELLDLMKARIEEKIDGADDEAAFEEQLKASVGEIVRRQVEAGIDVVTDGEQSKIGFFAYVRERLDGFETRPGRALNFAAEINAFPEYYEDYFARAMTGRTVAPISPTVCVGPVSYKGHAAITRDIANLKAAVEGLPTAAVFMPSVAPSGAGSNEYYASREEYLAAVGEAMRHEYLAIVDAGFLLQIDDPFLTESYSEPGRSVVEWRRGAEEWVEGLNHALRGIPPEKIRFHTCYGINEGPRVHDAPMADVAPVLMKINAGAYSFEAANPRHEHEYRVWESVKLPEGKVLIPGTITHASNIVEHPEWIAERIVRFAERVGRKNVIAGADCGFSSQATYKPEVHPKVVWAKFKALAEGAALATKKLWGA